MVEPAWSSNSYYPTPVFDFTTLCLFVTVHTCCYLITLPSRQLLGYSLASTMSSLERSYLFPIPFLPIDLVHSRQPSPLYQSIRYTRHIVTPLPKRPIHSRQACMLFSGLICRSKEGGLSSIRLSLFSLISPFFFLSRFFWLGMIR